MSETAASNSRRTLYIVLGAIGALLILVAVLLVVLIGQNNSAADQGELDRVTAICEAKYDDPFGADLDGFTQCQEDLLSR